MYEIIKLYGNICLFRKGPQDVPHSYFLLQFSIMIYAFSSLLLLHLSTDWLDSVLQLLAEIVLVFVFIYLALWYMGKTKRYIQTLSSFFGTDAVISFISLPAFSVISNNQQADYPFLVIIVLIIWHWLISAHILRHALDKPFIMGLGFSLMYILSSIQIMSYLFGA